MKMEVRTAVEVKSWLASKIKDEASSNHCYIDIFEGENGGKEFDCFVIAETEKAINVYIYAENINDNLCKFYTWIPKSQVLNKKVIA